MKNSSKFIIVLLLSLVLGVSITGCGGKLNNEDNLINKDEISEIEENDIISIETLKGIPEFKCTDVNGNEVSNEIFKDSKITLVNLWGTWCGPCVAELPSLQEIYDEGKDKGVSVVGIVEDGMNNEEEVKKILEQSNVKFINIVPDEKFYDDFVTLCSSYPASLLVDSDGNVVSELISGPRTKEEYKELIDEALEKLK